MSIKNIIPLVSIAKRNIAARDNRRVRNPVSRSRMTIRGQFPSTKMQRMIAWESQLERRACYLFEFCSNIEAFREQPCRFMIPYEDQVKRYTPDFEVVWSSGVISYFEIKPLKKVDQLREYWCAIHQCETVLNFV